MEAQIRDFLEKAPVGLLLAAFAAWIAWDTYSFITDDASPLVTLEARTVALRGENDRMRKQISDNRDFLKKLDLKKLELRALAQQLDQMKATLSETFEVAPFMRMVDTEANRVGMVLNVFKPVKTVTAEYYTEHQFEMTFSAAFAQLLVFLERLSAAEKIVRIDDYELKRTAPPGKVAYAGQPIIDLSGKMLLRAYSYKGSSADEAAKKLTPEAPATAAPPTGGKK